jgi:signal transduction histidine kinase
MRISIFPKKTTFRAKLLIAFLLMNVVLIPFSVTNRIAHTRSLIFDRETNAVNNIGRLVANEVAQDLNTDRKIDLLDVLALSIKQTHIEFVSVLDETMKVLYSTDYTLLGSSTRYKDSKGIEYEKGPVFITSFPLVKFKGSIQLGYSLEGVRQDLSKAFWSSISIGALMLAMTLGIAWFMSGILTEPLDRMIAIAHRYATGDFTARVSVSYRDNIGELAQTLNDMAAQLSDLTENMQSKIKEKTRLLEESNKKLLELDKLKSDFVAMVSHELRTPLTSIIGFAKTMQSLKLTPEQRLDYLRIVESEGRRLAELIEEYLDISKIESGNFAIKTASFDFRRLVAETMDSLNVQYAGRITSRIEENIPEVTGDRNMLKRVLVNVVDNACKYSSAESPVTVTVQTQDEKVVVSVEDNGPGIPKEDHERVFQKFYRGKIGAASRTRGTGLGLAISRGIVEAHGGTIRIGEGSDQGTQIIIEIPVSGPTLATG